MNRARLAVRLGRPGPHHDEAVTAVLGAEALDVVHQRLGQLHLVGALLHPEAVELLDPLAVEHRVHRHDSLELRRDGRDVALLEHAGGARGFERVGGDRIPCAEHEVVERRERNEVLDEGIATLAARAEPDVRHLRDGTDRDRAGLAGRFDTGDQRRRDSAETGEQHTQLSGGRGDRARLRHRVIVEDHRGTHNRGSSGEVSPPVRAVASLGTTDENPRLTDDGGPEMAGR